MDKDTLSVFLTRFVRDMISRDVIPMIVDVIVRHQIKISKSIIEKLEGWGVNKESLQEFDEECKKELEKPSVSADNSGREIQSDTANKDLKGKTNTIHFLKLFMIYVLFNFVDSVISIADEQQIEKLMSSFQLATISERTEVFNKLPPMQVVFNQRWIYLSGLPKNTTVEEVEYHLGGMWPDTTFSVEDLKLKGNYSAFKVGYKDICYYELLDVSRWPNGVIVDIFKNNDNLKCRQPKN